MLSMEWLDNKIYIWIGPGVKKVGLSRNTIFKGKFPQHIGDFLEEYKTSGLMIPVGKLSIVNRNRKDKGNLYDELEKRLIQKLGGK